MKINWLNFLTCRTLFVHHFLSRVIEVCIFLLSTFPYDIIFTQFQLVSVLSFFDLTRRCQRNVCQQQPGLIFLPQRALKWSVAQNTEDLQLSSGGTRNSRLIHSCCQWQAHPELCLADSNYKTILISEMLM